MSNGENRKRPISAIDEVIRAQNRLTESASLGGATFEVMRQLQQPGSHINRLLDDLARNQSLLRAALGPLEDSRHLKTLIGLSGLDTAAERMRTMLEDYGKRFALPEISVTHRLLKDLEKSGAWAAMQEIQKQSGGIRKAIEAMRSPWLDMQNQLQSVAGLAEIQNIGISLQRFPAFDDTVTEALRHALGDWRDRITWPEAIFADPMARSDFYTSRGFNRHLTDFPQEAFEESLDIAGLASAGPDVVEDYRGADEPADENDEETELARNSVAYNQLLRFETHMRRFIEARMRAAWGDKWIKQRVPGDLRQQWVEKQQKDRDNGRHGQPLIAYADFTDYEKIIVRNDNWESIFKAIFRRQEFVTEAFQRLYPLRLSTMHSRILTLDDELFLRVEVKRVLKAIGISI